MSLVAPTLQGFFTDRLANQRQASPRTIASYRDSLRILVVFVHARTGKTPCTLDWEDLDTETICAFLDHLEAERHNSPRTRNLRLTAIRSLFAYASVRHPEHAALIQRVLPSPPNGSTSPSCRSSPPPRSTPSSMLSIGADGRADATGRCSSWPCRPGCASPS